MLQTLIQQVTTVNLSAYSAQEIQDLFNGKQVPRLPIAKQAALSDEVFDIVCQLDEYQRAELNVQLEKQKNREVALQDLQSMETNHREGILTEEKQLDLINLSKQLNAHNRLNVDENSGRNVILFTEQQDIAILQAAKQALNLEALKETKAKAPIKHLEPATLETAKTVTLQATQQIKHEQELIEAEFAKRAAEMSTRNGLIFSANPKTSNNIHPITAQERGEIDKSARKSVAALSAMFGGAK